ncbi:MAG: sigma-70 family RNA polymerase sigma factor [Planctomycetota bacterium]
MIESTFATWRLRLLRFCSNLLRHGHDAEEVVQDVFTRLLEQGDRIDLSERPEVVLFAMARNRCIDLRRKRAPSTGAALELVAPGSGVAADVAEALALLPFEQREVMLLTTVDGLGYREVATILGCSLGTVAARKYAAIERLQRSLRP